MPNTREKRLTYKRSLDGHEDVGLCEGVTVGEAICKLADLEEAGQGWIPVTERLPENKKCVLMYSADGGVAEGVYEESRKRWIQWRWSVLDVPKVTHWMPLPQPPKEV